MKPGQILTLRSSAKIRVWQVQGIYLGGLNQEDVVGITPLDRDGPDTPYRQHELFVPLAIMQAAFGEKPQEGKP
jgi:hypothetical protein